MVSQTAPETNRTRATTSPDPNGPSTPIPSNRPTPPESWSVEAALTTLPNPPPSTPPPPPPLLPPPRAPQNHQTRRLAPLPHPQRRIHLRPHVPDVDPHDAGPPGPLLAPQHAALHANGTGARHGRGSSRRYHAAGRRGQGRKVPAREHDDGLHDGDPAAGVDGGAAGGAIRAVWQEYEDGATLEARFVHDVDKVELLLQMMEYERRGEGRLDLGEFLSVAQRVELEEMKGWCREVLREREEFWRGVGVRPARADVAERLLSRAA
ncbi:MAG: hydrolase-hd superfamily [Lasallia pustulata]|uniref:Hydrolase-hd superfamily n=1 Tax=Lasallia pustulata TaxID=136370 RepID=A0A5M8Q073_9LECA|nr:MAG: hydrolase-hd superfamily [Lasallia pustulata]